MEAIIRLANMAECDSLKGFQGKVPVPGGTVSVSVDQEEIRVYSEIPGGTLYVDGKTYTLEAKKECRVRRKSDV